VAFKVTHGWALLLLVIPVYAYVMLHQSAWIIGLRRKRLIGILRAIILSCIVLALAGLELHTAVREQSVVFVMDTSRSVGSLMPEAEQWIRAAIDHRRTGDQAAVVVFGRDALVEMPVTDTPLWDKVQSLVAADHTDIEAALRLAHAILPASTRRRIVLVSDGQQTRGDALSAVRSLAAAGIAVDVKTLSPEKGKDVLVSRLDAPSHVHEGEQYDLSIRLWANYEGSGTVRVFQHSTLLAEFGVTFGIGENVYFARVIAGNPGIYPFRVVVEAPEDTISSNNEAAAIVSVSGQMQALVLEGEPGAGVNVSTALEMAGASVRTLSAEQAPQSARDWAQYDMVVLVEVPATALPDTSMRTLEIAVRDLGRGLVMVGGEESFGPGGYFRTPVERALPVYMDIRGRGEIPSLGLLLVIDKSGSMSDSRGGITKMDLAKEAAIRSTEILTEKDVIGVIAFDSDSKWVVEPVSPIELLAIQDAIASIRAGGGTNIYPGLAMAYEALLDQQTKYKHIILLTDGISATGGDYDKLAADMRQAGITLSCVAVGQDADAYLLSHLADIGEGRYYYTDDVASVPKIFTKETILASRNYYVEELFVPAAAWDSALLRSLEAVPPLMGYVATTSKDTATVSYTSHRGEPVLASWQYGLGRAVAWTSDTRGRWSGEWIAGGQMFTLWQNIAGWVTRPARLEGFDVETRVAADTAEITLRTELLSEVDSVECRIVRPDQTTYDTELDPVAPGVFRTTIPVATPGAYLLQISPNGSEGVLGHISAGIAQQYSPEFRSSGSDEVLLEQITRISGGQMLDSASEAYRPNPDPAHSSRLMAPYLLILALLLLPLEVAARKLQLGPEDVQTFLGYAKKVMPGRRRPVFDRDVTLSRLMNRKQQVSTALGDAKPKAVQPDAVPSQQTVAPPETPVTKPRKRPQETAIDTVRLLEHKRNRKRT